MVSRFEKGRYYRCLLKERGPMWNSGGLMDGVLDGQPHLCIATSDWAASEASFDNAARNVGMWEWGLDEFEEAPMNPLW